MIRHYRLLLAASLAALMLIPGTAPAQNPRDMGGWEKDSTYNRHYAATEMDDFKGIVVGITEIVPLPGMSPGVALEVREGKGADSETITVHLGPSGFLDPKNLGLKKGDRVKIKGVWAEIDGKDVFMAAKVKKGDYFELKVRLTQDGTPFWTMSPEQLEKERKASQAALER